MKVLRKIVILYLLFILLIIFLSSILMLFVKIKGYNNYSGNFLNYLKEHNFKQVLFYMYSQYKFWQKGFLPNPKNNIIGYEPVKLFYSIALNLGIIAFPIFFIVAIYVIKKINIITFYPISDKLLNKKKLIKLDKKKNIIEYRDKKSQLNNNKNKNLKLILKKEYIHKFYAIKLEKIKWKQEVKIEYILAKNINKENKKFNKKANKVN